MANFGQLILTTMGIQAQFKAQGGAPLKFKRIAMGSGNFSGNIMTLTKLVTENVSVPISKGYVQSKNNAYIVEGFFTNEGLQTGFEWREIGLFVEGEDGSEILYCYANAGNTYDFIPATEDERYAKNVRIATTIGNAQNVSFAESEGFLYVDLMTFNEAMADMRDEFSNQIILTTEKHITDSAAGGLKINKIYGKSTQGANPQEITSVGDTGTIEVKVCGKNLIKQNTHAVGTNVTVSGVTFTINKDGSITANGTSTERVVFAPFNYLHNKLVNGRYILSGCPKGASAGTYQLYMWNADDNEGYYRDFGDGVEFDFVNNEQPWNIAIIIEADTKVSNLTFYPMLRHADIEDSTCEPHTEQVVTLNTEGGLPGIPVSSGGNYTDATGQQWIADFIDVERGLWVHNIGVIESYAGEAISGAYMSTTGELTEGATVLYVLSERYGTELSPSELAALCSLHTYESVTNIFCEADMEMEYGRSDAAACAIEAYNKSRQGGNGIPLGNGYGNNRFGNDLNDWLTTGLYNTTEETINIPTGDGWGTVFVMSGFAESGRLAQIYYAWNYQKGKIYHRYRDYDGTWTDWVDFSQTAITYGVDRIYIGDGTNLNDILTCGCYKCTTSARASGLKNCPMTDAFILDVVPGTGNDIGITDATSYQYIVQRFQAASGVTCFRKIQSHGNGTITYGAWYRNLSSGDCVDNLTSTLSNRPLSANQGKVLNDNMAQINVYVDSSGNIHFVDSEGADTVIPFKRGNVSFHIKVTATAYCNNRTDRVAGYFYYEADCTIIDGKSTFSNVSNNAWFDYDVSNPGSTNQNPKITKVEISNFAVLSVSGGGSFATALQRVGGGSGNKTYSATSLSDYKNLTAENFIIVVEGINSKASTYHASGAGTPSSNELTLTPKVTYTASTGTISVTGASAEDITWDSSENAWLKNTITATYSVYRIG